MCVTDGVNSKLSHRAAAHPFQGAVPLKMEHSLTAGHRRSDPSLDFLTSTCPLLAVGHGATDSYSRVPGASRIP